MKKLLITLAAFCLSAFLFAQTANDFPYGGKYTNPGAVIAADVTGTVVKSPKKLPDALKNSGVIKVTDEYYYEGKKCTSEYELIYFNMNVTAKKGAEIKSGEELGTATEDTIKILARTTTIDPYLVSVSNTLPVKVNGYYYYFPGMLTNNTMKYLIYEPLNLDNVKWMYEHTTNPESDEDWTPGVSIFYWKLLMETELSAYPKKLTKASSFRGVGIESSMEIEYEGMKFSLGFQEGFLDYLLDEYKLGDKIYLYIDVDSVDAFSKTFNCYVRDFSLISPTEIIQQRIDIVKERVK